MLDESTASDGVQSVQNAPRTSSASAQRRPFINGAKVEGEQPLDAIEKLLVS
jgi:hypothetical protein